uniref:Transposon Ty3-G Gag-Pol polyprotein n=1 Tax=Cajanus cajan TaxID=3821 RepID=A0A151QUV6_CAJCA|nr:Transposon Ty3-G Gag-Pol polyprotein [Cajanus cajan]
MKESNYRQADHAGRPRGEWTRNKEEEKFTPLNVPRRHILHDVNSASLFEFLAATDRQLGPYKTDWCEFHRTHEHTTENFFVLGRQIERLIKEGHLKKFIAGKQDEGSSDRRRRREGEDTRRGRREGRSSPRDLPEKNWARPTRPTITFSDADFEGVSPHEDDPIVVSAIVMGYNVKRVLVDQGSSTDIMFWEAFVGMKILTDRLMPYVGTLVGFAVRLDEGKTVKIGVSLAKEDEEGLLTVLKSNVSAFAWSAGNMPGIDPDFLHHRLMVDPNAKPVIQKRRKFGEDKRKAIAEETKKLLVAGHIREIQYPTWLANVIMVRKSNGNWRMCTDFTNLNKACPKDSYPLPNIDCLVNNASGYELLSFMDAYSGYNQVRMHPADEDNTAFIADQATYCYKVMPFGLKNAGATYQRLIDKVLANQLGRNVEAYVDDMVVKSPSVSRHFSDLQESFDTLARYQLKLNPAKCSFGVQAGKFLGFLLTHHECEKAFGELKQALTSPPILTKPQTDLPLLVYLSASDSTVSAVLVQERGNSQLPIYFVSRVLQGAEVRYQKIEKLALTIVITARKLRNYFQSYEMVIRTDHPIRQVLQKPDLAGRMMKWSIELSEFAIRYEPRGAIKAQVLADFLVELTPPAETLSEKVSGSYQSTELRYKIP